MMGGALAGFGTAGITPTLSPFASPWTTGAYGTHAPQQQLLQSLQQLLQLEYVQQQQLLQLVPHKIQQLQQIQQLIQLVAQQQSYQMHQGTFPLSSFGGPTGWLAGTQGVQPPAFGGHPGYVM
jgi:hypothetical protein